MNQKEVILVICVVVIAFIFGLLLGNYYGLPFHNSGKKSEAWRTGDNTNSPNPNANTPAPNANTPRNQEIRND